MSLVLLGHPAFKSSAPLVSVGNGVRAARIDLTNARYVVTGHTTAQVDLLKDGANDHRCRRLLALYRATCPSPPG